jgi:hypothetical protein
MPLKLIGVNSKKNRLPALDKRDGFALPMVLALGMVMLAFAGTSILVAQGDRNTAVQRRTTGASLLVSDGAISRALLELSKPNNSVLLIRSYDPVDTNTGKNYLGADGVPKNGDESGTDVDQWTGYNPINAPCYQQVGRIAPSIALTGTIGPDETYTIKAYHYDKQKKLGTLLVEGNYKGQASLVAVTFSIEPIMDDFPSLLAFDVDLSDVWDTGVVALRGRQILGRKGNIYYYPSHSPSPSLTGFSPPGNSNRASYLSALWSSTSQDGASSDTVGGKISACSLTPNLPIGTSGTNIGTINTSKTLTGSGGTVPTRYQVDTIDLASNEVLTVNTTGGPVYIDITDKGNPGNNPDLAITLRNSAQILNVRTDGQPPRVGDLRIMLRGNSQTNLYDKTCIQNAFLFSFSDEFRLSTSGPGCPGGNNTNFEGVIWAQAMLSSKNASANRPVSFLGGNTGNQYDTTITPGATSGIAVPDDVSSLSDLLEYIDWPARYRYGVISSWQRVN